MMTFFSIVAIVHIAGLYLMLLAMRRAPVGVEGSQGFKVIAEPELARAVVAAQHRTA
jgi:hypothetical protein